MYIFFKFHPLFIFSMCVVIFNIFSSYKTMLSMFTAYFLIIC